MKVPLPNISCFVCSLCAFCCSICFLFFFFSSEINGFCVISPFLPGCSFQRFVFLRFKIRFNHFSFYPLWVIQKFWLCTKRINSASLFLPSITIPTKLQWEKTLLVSMFITKPLESFLCFLWNWISLNH